MTYEDQKKELYFANAVIGVIDNVKTPMLMYQEEKDVVRKALRMYIDRIENDMRGRWNRNSIYKIWRITYVRRRNDWVFGINWVI